MTGFFNNIVKRFTISVIKYHLGQMNTMLSLSHIYRTKSALESIWGWVFKKPMCIRGLPYILYYI